MTSIVNTKRNIAINMLAEFLGSAMFSLLYFIFISRYISSEFQFSYPSLGFAIGLSFFAAVYIPFHTYRIHILPYFSIISALEENQWKVIWYKIPVQILGAFLGVILFHYINKATTLVNIEDIQKINLNDPYLTAIFNSFIVGTACYSFYIIRILVKEKRLMGTIFLGLIISFLFAISGTISGLSALNPFGLLFYHALEQQSMIPNSWFDTILIHVVAPLAASILVFIKMKNYLIEPEPESFENKEMIMRNYDI
jgi:glycerol uptake facilitator-like aquaporin